MKQVHEQVFDLSGRIAEALQRVVPPGFRAKVQVTVDNGVVRPENVSVEFRSPQPKAGMRNTQ